MIKNVMNSHGFQRPKRFSWTTLVALPLAVAGASTAWSAAAAGPSQSTRFCSDWRFAKGDPAGAEAPDFDDSSWSTVRLPHDWAIAGPFDPKVDGYAGKLPWQGVGWYRKSFDLNCSGDARVYLDFDGVMAFPQVYVNGKLAGTWDYGYTSFRVDATPFVNRRGKNVVAVRVDTRRHGSRWYPGAGIYRKVMLEVRGPVHVAHWGVGVTTPDVSDARATVKVELAVENHQADAPSGEVAFVLLDPDGQEVARATTAGPLPSGEGHFSQTIVLPKPRRWVVDAPQLYTLRTQVSVGGKIADETTTPFGIRTAEFTADDGFHLNGRRVQLYGVNLHHDQGPLGAAFNVRAMERQLEIMKEMGVNALRTSHNAPAPEVLELCDRMGIVVWDECFDKWNATADRVDGKPSHQEHAERHLQSLVMRDRNHPSVVLWSIGNEIPDDLEGVTPVRVAMMADVVRQYDSSRPVGIGCCHPEQVRKSMFEGVDLTGWNYTRRYAPYRERYPTRPVVYSESASALSTRGFYELPLPTNKTDFSQALQVNSYDLNAAPWSDIADREFRLMAKDRFVAGEFVWTGFDYLGEPTPFSKQAKSSYFGIVDLVGIPKDRYWLYRSYWRPDVTTVHILPHWNWPDRVGQPVPVFVYTNGDSAELFLNGRSLGRRTKGERPDSAASVAATPAAGSHSASPSTAASADPRESSYYDATYDYRLRWNAVAYEPGELKAVAYRDGREIGSAVMRTAGAPAAIQLTPDRTEVAASGDDLSYVLVEAFDKGGVPCPLADDTVRFHLTGPGEIAGVGNGNPLSLEPFQASDVKLFYGKAMLIVRTREGRAGDIHITAAADGLRGGEAAVRSSLP